jgi:hypothetical protein
MEADTPGPHQEVLDWLAARQSQLDIVASTLTPTGKILDWVPPEPANQLTLAAAPRPEVTVPDDSQRPTRRVSAERGQPGPPGCIPILRPDVSQVPDLRSVENLGGKLRPPPGSRDGSPPDSPDFPGYFHALCQGGGEPLLGCETWLNVWDPSLAGAPRGDHSISQLWLATGRIPPFQTVEVGWTVDLSVNGDLAPHLFTYFTTNGYQSNGNNVGGYNTMYEGFVRSADPFAADVYPGFVLNEISSEGGPQYELGIRVQGDGNGNWYAYTAVDGLEWYLLGYYPNSLWGDTEGGKNKFATAYSCQFGGEVFSGLANPCATVDQMGSGISPIEAYGYAAYQRNIRVLVGKSWQDLSGIGLQYASPGCESVNYEVSTDTDKLWGSHLYFGGPVPEGFRLKAPEKVRPKV